MNEDLLLPYSSTFKEEDYGVPVKVVDRFSHYPKIDTLERENLKGGKPITQKLIVKSHSVRTIKK